jgi:transcription-repair coupling factor (superfamily II helicase)
MPSSSSLTLRALIQSAATRAGLAHDRGKITGLQGAARALYAAIRAHAAPKRLLVVVAPTDADLEALVADARFFLGILEGLDDLGAAAAVLPLPSHEVDPYRGLTPHLQVASTRATALAAVASGEARIVVASAAALLPRLAPPAQLVAAIVDLLPGTEIEPQLLAERLTEGGFTRQDPVDEHGEFCVRGGIVDVYPPGDQEPIRVEFIGDTVESLRRYDPATQRSTAAIDQAHIVPIRERLGQPDAPADPAVRLEASVFDYFVARRPVAYVVVEPDDVAVVATKFLEQISASYESLRQGATRGATRQDAAPPDRLFIDAEIIADRLRGAVTLEQLAIEGSPSFDTLRTNDEGSVRGEPVEPRTPDASHHVRCQPVPELNGRLQDFFAEARRSREGGEAAVFVATTPGRAERVLEMAPEYQVIATPAERAEDAHASALLVTIGHLTRGFRLPDGGLTIFAEADAFEEERRGPDDRRRSALQAFLSDLRDLKVGDYVVHVDHGIGAFVGLKQLNVAVGEAPQEFMELRYFGEDKLFVPVERLDLVQKYTGATKPPVDRLGGTSWEKAKTRVKKAMRDMAEDLLKLYAARKAVSGHAFSADSHWQQEFEDAFSFELTPDQTTAIADIKRDMEEPVPMDRLLCGDVGYGKTEVAMRAAFKAVMDGKQVALLAPTTVLAFQHQKTLHERFAGFPIRIDTVSRFRTRAEQKQVLDELVSGKVDIIVGTHRLLSKDVEFRDLGLLVVDEEQRFGVAHKERIKQLRKRVDVLTMTATPIPRTLNMSLVGIRDMSIIETPPRDRLSIQTHVVKFDSEVIRRAIRHELERGGQVYVVHNRVESIDSIGSLISRLVPEAKLAIGHGQMDEDALEKTMLDFMSHRHDVLVATTIVENGLDIPNANTIIINRADRYGLSQLYQLRGRVGRSDRPAYAFLLIPPEESVSPVARKRLAAVKEFSDLGSGFRVAALDLEIRGAGSLLGGEQSGHMETVGFEMYAKLLEEAVRELKGEEIEDDVRATVNLRVDLKIDEAYIPDMNQRLMVYRRIASARHDEDVDRALAEVRDRYGPPPESIMNLVDYGRIRVMADRLGIENVDREGDKVVFRFRPQTRLDPARLVSLVERRTDLTLVPPAGLRLDLKADASKRPRTSGRSAPSGKPQPPSGPWPELGRKPLTSTDILRTGSRTAVATDPTAPVRGGSWWTARATAGQVTTGFTKAEILKREAEDPRGPAGVFTRVGALLGDLLA